jgi:hypothetical protein
MCVLADVCVCVCLHPRPQAHDCMICTCMLANRCVNIRVYAEILPRAAIVHVCASRYRHTHVHIIHIHTYITYTYTDIHIHTLKLTLTQNTHAHACTRTRARTHAHTHIQTNTTITTHTFTHTHLHRTNLRTTHTRHKKTPPYSTQEVEQYQRRRQQAEGAGKEQRGP